MNTVIQIVIKTLSAIGVIALQKKVTPKNITVSLFGAILTTLVDKKRKK